MKKNFLILFFFASLSIGLLFGKENHFEVKFAENCWTDCMDRGDCFDENGNNKYEGKENPFICCSDGRYYSDYNCPSGMTRLPNLDDCCTTCKKKETPSPTNSPSATTKPTTKPTTEPTTEPTRTSNPNVSRVYEKLCCWYYDSDTGIGQYSVEEARCPSIHFYWSSKTIRGEKLSDDNCFPPAVEQEYCYGNAKSFDEATAVAYGGYSDALQNIAKQLSTTTRGLKIYSYGNNISQSGCFLKQVPKVCEPVSGGPIGSNKLAITCEGSTIKTINEDTITCDTATSKGFYKIDCNTDIKTSFDLENDGKMDNHAVSIYPGQGVGFKLTMYITKTCKGTFDAASWTALYDTLNRRKNAYAVHSADWYRYDNDIKSLKDSANTFNNWATDVSENPNVSLVFNTEPQKVTIDSFVSTIISDGNNASNKVLIGSDKTLKEGLTVRDFTYSNAANPRVIEYIPPEVKFDDISGNEATSTSTNVISGGNKIYTTLNVIDNKVYPMTLTVSNLSDKKTIVNDKCSVNVKKSVDLKYRIIDVSNPFINKDYPKGNNWYNSIYDYTKTIKSNIWSKNSLYTFNLPSSKIKEIQKSNSNDNNAYLGTCYKKDKDGITKEICNILEK